MVKIIKIEDGHLYYTDGRFVFAERIIWSEDGWKTAGVSYVGTSEADLHAVSDSDLLTLAGYTADKVEHRAKFLSVGCKRYNRYLLAAIEMINVEYDICTRIQRLRVQIATLEKFAKAAKAASGKVAYKAIAYMADYGIKFLSNGDYATVRVDGVEVFTCVHKSKFLYTPDGRKREYFFANTLAEMTVKMIDDYQSRIAAMRADVDGHQWLESVKKIQKLQEEIAALKQGMAPDTLTFATQRFHI